MGKICRFALFIALAGALACGGKKTTPAVDDEPASNPAPAKLAANVVFDLTRDFSKCTLGHDGVLLDFGDPTLASSFGLHDEPAAREITEHEGATWIRVHERKMTLSFLAPAEILAGDVGLVIEARARGGAARTMAVSINGKSAATLTLDKTSAQVSAARAVGVEVVEGQNEVSLAFGGAGRGAQDMLAEIDWFHIGPAGEAGQDATYSAPTRADALVNAAVGGIAKSAVSLHGPGFAACTTFIPKSARFDASLAVTKGGEADVALRVHRDRATTEQIASWHLGEGEAAAWKNVTVPLPSLGTITEVELAVVHASKGARAFVGDAHVVRETSDDVEAPAPHADGVVLIVLGDVSPRAVSTFGGRLALPEIDALAQHGFTFTAHRAATTLSSGAMASMLTGLSPRDHGVLDQSARMPNGITTIADAARQAGIDTAMFTANPLTARAFGFDRGFGSFVAHSPVEDTPATQVFDDAAKFIEGKTDGRFPRRDPCAWRASTVGCNRGRLEGHRTRELHGRPRATSRRGADEQSATHTAGASIPGLRPRACMGPCGPRADEPRPGHWPFDERASCKRTRRKNRRHRDGRSRGGRNRARAVRRSRIARRATSRSAPHRRSTRRRLGKKSRSAERLDGRGGHRARHAGSRRALPVCRQEPVVARVSHKPRRGPRAPSLRQRPFFRANRPIRAFG